MARVLLSCNVVLCSFMFRTGMGCGRCKLERRNGLQRMLLTAVFGHLQAHTHHISQVGWQFLDHLKLLYGGINTKPLNIRRHLSINGISATQAHEVDTLRVVT